MIRSFRGASFYDSVIQGSFVPIFAFLFGISAWLLYSSSQRRMPITSARWLMVRRFAWLLPIGAVNLLVLYSGDILTMYAVMALVLIIPALFLPRGLVLALGVLGTVVCYALWGSTPLIAATLMVAGFGAAQWGLPQWLESASIGNRRIKTVVFSVMAVSGVVLAVIQNHIRLDPSIPAFSDHVAGFRGLFFAIAIVIGLSLVWTRSGRRARTPVLLMPWEALGKTALTNYLAASALVQLVLIVVPDTYAVNLWLLPVMTVVILAAQIIISQIWLQHFRYGPVEWLWRCATRWEIVSFKR